MSRFWFYSALFLASVLFLMWATPVTTRTSNGGANTYAAYCLDVLHFSLYTYREEAELKVMSVKDLSEKELKFLSKLDDHRDSQMLVPLGHVQAIFESDAKASDEEEFIGIWDTAYTNRHFEKWRTEHEPAHCAISNFGKLSYLSPDQFKKITADGWVPIDTVVAD